MSKGNGFFDGATSASPGKTPVDQPEVIRGVPFVDSPREVEDEDNRRDGKPYVPTESEWRDLKSDVKFLSWSTGFAIGLAAVAFIFALGAFVTK